MSAMKAVTAATIATLATSPLNQRMMGGLTGRRAIASLPSRIAAPDGADGRLAARTRVRQLSDDVAAGRVKVEQILRAWIAPTPPSRPSWTWASTASSRTIRTTSARSWPTGALLEHRDVQAARGV